ncbi:MAG: hypothetical protein L0I62_01895 [Gammaproteobacteria bacterium]|nr:hypothetical protein [Gammaproteobacteria bacterium]
MAVEAERTQDPVRLTVGITAHRDLVATEESGIERLVGELFDMLAERFPDTPLQALCSLAEGGERVFARAAIARGIPLVVPLPLPREYYLDDFADPSSREEFETLSRDAKVFELPLRPGVTPEDVSRPGVLRDSEYAQLGVFVSSHSQILVAMWDGRPSDQLGGTAQIVQYRLFNLYPSLAAIRRIGSETLAEGENDLTFQIATSRTGTNGTPTTPREPLRTTWLTGYGESSATRAVPEKYARVFDMTAEFNRDRDRLCTDCEAGDRGLLGLAAHGGWPAGVRSTHELFAAADCLADHFQRRLNLALRSTYTLAVLMGAAFVGYSTVPEVRALLYAFLVLFAAGFCLYEIARRGEWHRKYLEYRVLAEGLRVQCYWTIAGIGDAGDGRFAHENFLQLQDPELGWIRQVMRDAALRAGPPEDAGDAGLEFAQRHWVGDGGDTPAGGQLGYYTRQARQRYRLHRATEMLGAVCLWSGMGIAVVLAILESRLLGSTTFSVLIFLLGMLPLVAAVRGAYAHKRADKELIKQYRFMANTFRNARRRLDAATDAKGRREVLWALGDAALDEHAEWILMHRERPLERTKI